MGQPGRPPSLNDADVIRARKLKREGKPFYQIARMMGVDRNTLRAAVVAFELRNRASSNPQLAAKIEKATASRDNTPIGAINDVARMDGIDPAVKYLVARDLAECFLNDSQIALKRGVSKSDVMAIRRMLTRGEPFDCPPGFVEPSPSSPSAPAADHRGNILRESLFNTAQRVIDAVSDEKIQELPADKMIKSVKDLVSSAESIKDATSSRDAHGAIVSRARNVLVFNGDVDLSQVDAQLLLQHGLTDRPEDERIIDVDAEPDHEDAPPPLPVPPPSSDAADDPFAI